MLNFDFEKDCCGCGACYNSCPTDAIQMKTGKDGFLYPMIDERKCTGCEKCNQVCPHLNAHKTFEETGVKGVWLFASEDTDAKLRSASGAAFYEMALSRMKQGDYICGCVWNEHLKAEHIVGNDMTSLYRMQGSKYVQSDIRDSYKCVISLLRSGKRVLFSGTPCQAVAMHECVMAINNGKYRDQLITVGVLCHGVASPLAWESFKKWTADVNKSKLKSVNFRDKSQEGYKKSYCRYEYESGHVSYFPTFLPSSKYIEATLVYNLALRRSCSHCDCKGINTAVDLILGDWYAEYKDEGALGTSCIVAFTDRGKVCAQEGLNGLRDFPYEAIVEHNRFIIMSEKLSGNREKFFEMIQDYHAWKHIEKLYPKKYILKKILVKIGLYDIIKRKNKDAWANRTCL